MSRRHRHPTRNSATPSYPSPAKRQAIIARRGELFEQIVNLLIENRPPDDPAYNRLARQYGKQEVQRQLGLIQKLSSESDFLIDEPMAYRKYRQTFARFGGGHRFLGRMERETLVEEFAMISTQRKFLSATPTAPGRREQELYELMLMNVDSWEDITPPDAPTRPPDWVAAPPEQYSSPAADLLTWGWQAAIPRIYTEAKDPDRWQLAIPALLRMVFDQGLLNGWPGEAASWASYHALYLLGALHVHTAAVRLLALTDQENDWLSDRLPKVWAMMGEPVEPALWSLLDDESYSTTQRGVVIAGLRSLAVAHAVRRDAIVAGLANRLSDSAYTNPTINGYIVFVLDQMEAVAARKAIANAFAQEKVDTHIMQPNDVGFLDM